MIDDRGGTADSSPEISQAIKSAWETLSADRHMSLIAAMVDIPSPTGDEAELSRFLTTELSNAGLESRFQQIDDRQANAIGRLAGNGTGPDLLLYAPIDTLTVGTEEEDLPYVGDELRSDMRCESHIVGERVIGLGASNPKGHAACVIAAAEAIAAIGIELRGDLVVGLGAGGMPSNSRPGATRANTGQGNGCSFMLEQGLHTDYAILAKPGWSVAWEEVGLCWFTVRVRGIYNYVGSRHRLPYRNALVDASRLILALEKWFPIYSERNSSGLVAPQGHVASIRGGWERTAALSPAVCEFTVDLRISPRTSPVEARRQFAEAMTHALEELGDVECSWEMDLSIPGTSTDPDNWIVRSCTWAWEETTRRAHRIDDAARSTSGATDCNILRNRGIPTARVGMPRVTNDDGREVDFGLGQNAVSANNMMALSKVLVAAAIDTCLRSRDELEPVRRARPSPSTTFTSGHTNPPPTSNLGTN